MHIRILFNDSEPEDNRMKGIYWDKIRYLKIALIEIK